MPRQAAVGRSMRGVVCCAIEGVIGWPAALAGEGGIINKAGVDVGRVSGVTGVEAPGRRRRIPASPARHAKRAEE